MLHSLYVLAWVAGISVVVGAWTALLVYIADHAGGDRG
jgi:hypothetical protein